MMQARRREDAVTAAQRAARVRTVATARHGTCGRETRAAKRRREQADGVATTSAMVVVQAQWATEAEAAGRPVAQVLHALPAMVVVQVGEAEADRRAEKRRRGDPP